MLRIGLTGGIGSGKTTVAMIFEVLGVPVYYADVASKKLMNEDDALQQQIIHHFGKKSYSSGTLNRQYISAIVFSDHAKLALLNSLVHPATIAAAEKWMQQQTTPYAIKEAALIFESNSHKKLDHVIGVAAPYALRLGRSMERNQFSEEEVKARMNQQMNEDEKIAKCNFVIINDEKSLLIPQVNAVHEQLLMLAK